jgi:hypothetical protein
MNYQYRFGTNFTIATKTLYADGGWTRYYQGLTAALFQGPISRFGDTAANAGILALLDSNPYMRALPVLVKTIFVSTAAACFRMVLTPIDTIKTTLQTQGKQGVRILKNRVRTCLPVEESAADIIIIITDRKIWHWDDVVWCYCHRSCHVRGQLPRMLNYP